jgi:hypothetical protein
MRPVQRLSRGGDFVGAKRGTVRGCRALLVRRAVADDGLATDQGRPRRVAARRFDRGRNGVRVVTIDFLDNRPAIGAETRGRDIGEPGLGLTVD